MELELCLPSVALLVVLMANGVVCEGSVLENESLHNTLVQRIDNIQRQLAEVTKSMRFLNADIGKTLFNCMDRHNTRCEAVKTDAPQKTQGDASSFGGLDKRSVRETPLLARPKSFYTELFRKQAMVNHLMGVIRGADYVLKNERKRTCNLNLGFHCETEEISDFADMYDFLSSEKSPGKKRSARSLA